MTKQEALKLIDNHKNDLINPLEILYWSYLRATINQIPEGQWNNYYKAAIAILSR